MEAEVNYFDDWDEWDSEIPSKSPENGWEKKTPSGSSSDWGERPPVAPHTLPGGDRNNNEPDVYVIRGVSEVPLWGMGTFEKILNGIPLSAENQINLALMQSGNLGHGGGALNGVIFGKIEYQTLAPNMRVRIKGKRKGGKFIIQKLWDVDSGNLPVMINHYWRDPQNNRGQRYRNTNPTMVKLFFLVLAVIVAAALLFSSGVLQSMTKEKLTMVAVFVGILAFIKVFHINIFNNPFVQKVLLFVGLVAIAYLVPGGESVMVGAIMLYGLYLIIKSIIK